MEASKSMARARCGRDPTSVERRIRQVGQRRRTSIGGKTERRTWDNGCYWGTVCGISLSDEEDWVMIRNRRMAMGTKNATWHHANTTAAMPIDTIP